MAKETYVDPTRCIERVWNQTGWRSHQCHFKRKFGDYCHIHSKEAKEERAKEALRADVRRGLEMPRFSLQMLVAIIGRIKCSGYHMTMHSTSYTCIEWNRTAMKPDELCSRCKELSGWEAEIARIKGMLP